jgi:hypothetical protein
MQHKHIYVLLVKIYVKKYPSHCLKIIYIDYFVGVIKACFKLYVVLSLSLTKSKENYFNSATIYKKYPNFTPEIFKMDYLRSQWNQDKFSIMISDLNIIYSFLKVNLFEQLPTHIQENINPPEKLTFVFYSSLSGWGGNRCKFKKYS